jgi:YD repeat-containing protein
MQRFPVGSAVVAALLLTVMGQVWAAVGRTPGYADVSASGQAGYSIPLTLPPGARDLTPSLALVYSSGVGQSTAGVGWSITGLSAIARCASTVAQDGIAREVRNDLQDRYCLDGQKLRLVSGTYGVAGSEYRTEIESFRRIKAYGAAGNGPAYFVVEGADGLLYEYGNSADSRIESLGQSTPWAWALNRARDRQGNDIVFAYAEDAANGGYRPDRIDYTGNPSLGVSAPYTVDFVYEPKPTAEIDSGYLAGSRIEYVTRLDRIDVLYQATTLVRRYDLTYEAALSGSGRSRLAAVQECAGSPLECFTATSFTYQNGSIGLGAESSAGATVPTIYAWPLDVNGDGREDLVYPSSATSGSGTWMVLFASASGGYGTPVNTGILNTNHSGAIPIDYNQDGKDDLLVPYSGSTWWVMLGSSAGLATPVNTAAPVTTTGTGSNARALDVDGDGRQDLVWADLVGYAGGDAIRYRLRLAGSGFSSTVQVLVGPLPADQKISSGVFGAWEQRMPTRTPDFNGDGRADVAYRLTERIDTSTLAPPPAAPEGATAPTEGEASAAASYLYLYWIAVACPGVGSFAAIAADAASQPYFGDFNGDGKSDLLYFDANASWQYRFSTGVGFTAESAGPGLVAYGAGWVIKDWDGDGYDDALGPHTASGTWHLMRSSGEAFAAPVTTGIALGSGTSSYTITDLNGDGLKDLAYRDSANAWRYRLHSLDTSLPDLLVSAQDGFGATASFTYLPLTNSAVYTKGTGATYPTVDVQAGRWVVSRWTASDGTGGNTTFDQNFTYEAARRDLQGRGFLGFAKRTSVDTRLGHNLKTIETYRQDFPYLGALASLERQQSGGTRIAFTSHTWSNLTYGTGYATRRHPYVSASNTDEHEVGGGSNGTKIRTVSTTVAATGGIDSTSGLIKDVTTVTTEVATGIFAGSYRTERLQHTAVLNDTTSWCLGRPTASQVTASHTLNSGTAVTRTSDATWDATNCRPTQVRAQPGHATLQVTVGLSYDSFGNLSGETVTGIGMTARTTTTNWGTTGRFPVSTTNPLSQTTTLGWNLALGRPGSVTDPNGLATSWSYDVFGRRTLESRPDSTSTAWTYTTCPSGCDSRVKYLVQQDERDSSGATVRTDVHYLNRWDAVSYEKRQQLTPTDTVWTARREFDAKGRLTRDYVPYFTAGTDNGYRQLSYDALDRVTAEALYAAGGVLDRTTGFAYSGFSRTRTDPLGHATSQVTNAWGDLMRVTDAASGQMNYESDAFGLFKKATDPGNNVLTQATYNVRGMATQLVDADRGTWSFVPNALGEVTSQTDARSQTTSFVYDKLGRLTSRTEAEGTSTWTWGTSSAAKNIGRLQSLSGPGYSESLSYDSLGRLASRSVTSDAT